MYLRRQLNLAELLRKKSFFLFGPRSVGKTSLVREELGPHRLFDLLDAETYRDLLARPRLLAEVARGLGRDEIVVVDEVQKLPSLLDEVHRVMEERGTTFLLTGSSARKLRRGAANMLAGRAWRADLFPLVYAEIPDFELDQVLNRGGLPVVYQSAEPEEELRAYVGTYLQEEIQAEALTRNLPAFSAFLDAIGLANGQEINYHSLASDCGVSPGTLKGYVEILSDTLLGFSLPPFKRGRRRKTVSRSKHYLCDIGITKHLCRRGVVSPGSELFGAAFEHFVILEVRAWNSYSRHFLDLTYWRTTSQMEVDLVVGDRLAVEIKSTTLVKERDLKHLRKLKEEGAVAAYAVVSRDAEKRITDDEITIYPWKVFLEELWRGDLLPKQR